MTLPNLRAADESQLAATISVIVSESAATTKPAVVSEAAPANASGPPPVMLSVAAGVCGCEAASTDSAVAEATRATAISAVTNRGTTPTARSLPRLGLEQLERASQPSKVSLSDQPLSRAILFDFPVKQALSYSSESKAIFSPVNLHQPGVFYTFRKPAVCTFTRPFGVEVDVGCDGGWVSTLLWMPRCKMHCDVHLLEPQRFSLSADCVSVDPFVLSFFPFLFVIVFLSFFFVFPLSLRLLTLVRGTALFRCSASPIAEPVNLHHCCATPSVAA
jgi:hypothetical protein